MNRTQRLQWRGLAEYLRGSLWFLPTVAVVVAIALAEVARHLSLPDASLLGRVIDADVDGARGLLVAVAGSVITVTGLVFSLMVVSLQLASQQFSPRLLRTFLRDRGTQIVLSIFLATFAYSLAVLRSVRTVPEPSVPEVAVAGAFGFALASVAALVYFVHHATEEIRVDTMMRDVERETRSTIAYVYAHQPAVPGAATELLHPPADAVPIPAPRSGFLQDISLDALAEGARAPDLLLCVHAPIGDYAVTGTPLVWAWHREGGAPSQEALSAVLPHVHSAIQIGHERTSQGDVAFGLRQLADIAVKALSPAINDPTTAVHSIHRLTSVLCVLAARPLEPLVGTDPEGTVRATVPGRGFDEYLDLACGQIRRFGAAEPAVTSALLHMLSVVGGCADDEAERTCVRREAALVLAAARDQTRQEEDLQSVESAWANVQRALAGDQRP